MNTGVKDLAPGANILWNMADALAFSYRCPLAILQSFFDESFAGNPTHGVMVVGGYIFTKLKFLKFERSWRQMLLTHGLPYFRMSECVRQTGAFKGMSDAQADQVARKAISIIKANLLTGIAISVEQDVFGRVAKRERYHLNAYQFCVVLALMATTSWVSDRMPNSEVAYIFEDGGPKAGATKASLSKLLIEPGLKSLFRYHSLTFAEKEKARGCQAADMLSWLWFQDTRRRVAGENRPPRKDLQALTDGAPHTVVHADEEMIYDIMRTVRENYEINSVNRRLATKTDKGT